ncbi:hypothetical protein [Dictyobacter kobayashii]|uniref:Uncharacterized protein n=1 Tax=Dictyobacter kobayashii TaxID=2014872 RepID=A0A402AY10_9CHLR|nr:hypothetical protein [Dictyobacter kobayashii]GCE23965.1 hypothetical protein KDK_77650 [Dictyobacter kobayashii]
MLRQVKLRIGAILLLLGSLLALAGEALNLGNNDPTQGGWFLPMILVALGTLIFIYGFNMYAQLSDDINLLGMLASGLLFIGGLVFIIGVIAVNAILVPMLLGMAQSITTAINTAGNTAQNVTNTTSNGLNTIKNGISGLFGQSTSGSDIPSVQVPQLSGMDIVNKALAQFHLPPLPPSRIGDTSSLRVVRSPLAVYYSGWRCCKPERSHASSATYSSSARAST